MQTYLKTTSSIGCGIGILYGFIRASEMTYLENDIVSFSTSIAGSIILGAIGAAIGPVGVPASLVYGGFKFVEGIKKDYDRHCMMEEAKLKYMQSRENTK
jgi:hypothetical protein